MKIKKNKAGHGGVLSLPVVGCRPAGQAARAAAARLSTGDAGSRPATDVQRMAGRGVRRRAQRPLGDGAAGGACDAHARARAPASGPPVTPGFRAGARPRPRAAGAHILGGRLQAALERVAHLHRKVLGPVGGRAGGDPGVRVGRPPRQRAAGFGLSPAVRRAAAAHRGRRHAPVRARGRAL
eukprot:scaffold4124_cov109-Isochrysis_galbana.AAC.11